MATEPEVQETSTMEEVIAEFYENFCKEHGLRQKKDLLKFLEQSDKSEDYVVKLPGNKCADRFGDHDVMALSTLLLNLERLIVLDLSFNQISDEGIPYVLEILERATALRSLDLSFNSIQEIGAELLAHNLKKNTSVLSLNLSGNKIRNKGALHLVGMLQANNVLQELQLENCDLVDQSVLAIGVTLATNSALQALDVSRPLLFSQQEEWAERFSMSLVMNTVLLELHLGTMLLTDTGTERLTEGLMHNHTLRYLDLRNNKVTRDGAGHLSKLLKLNHTLEFIDLSSNRIEDVGAIHLSEAISWPGSSLRELSVTKNNIGSPGLLALAAAIKLSLTMSHIYIWGNLVDEPVCQAYMDLLNNERLTPEQTDVCPYIVDDHVYLAQLSHYLRRHIYSGDSLGALP